MLIGAIADDITQVFGIPQFSVAPAFIQGRVLIDINSAIQQLQNSGEEYYGREDLTVNLTADTESYTLQKDVQSVLDPVRLDDGTVLRKLTSRGQLLQWGQLFNDQLDDSVASGSPTCFYIESLRDTTNADDVNVVLHLVPKPSSTVAGARKLTVPVIREPATFVLSDLVAGTALLPVPQKYIESIFLPLARWNATTSFLFYEKEKIPRYEMEYSRALQLLDQADPRRLKRVDRGPNALGTDQPSAQNSISPVQKQPK
jgi:hypothetical protein